MIEIKNKYRCCGCSACVSCCPVKCIEMMPDKEGFLYPEVCADKCINCHKCESICPVINPIPVSDDFINKAYASFTLDSEVRLKSSSGGVFSMLSEWILKQRGVVFGAAFNERFQVVHICVNKSENLGRLRGSKYVQSNIGDTYFQAKEYLIKGTPVLFSGTPCQISGLKNFLGCKYENLVTQDFICHGVPSDDIWQRYLRAREKQYGAKVEQISFRNKKSGWKKFSMAITFQNGKSYCRTLDKDPMLKAFLKDICLRPSCYACAFKTGHRTADITLADYWSIDNINQDLDDDRGTSLVIINSPKGDLAFAAIRDKLKCVETDLSAALCVNSAATNSVLEPDNRKTFMSDIKSNNFDSVVRQYCHEKFLILIKNRIKILISKVKRIVI